MDTTESPQKNVATKTPGCYLGSFKWDFGVGHTEKLRHAMKTFDHF